MHQWACFCNTKALLLVSPSPLTRSALHPNALWGEEAARRWLGNAEKLEFRERGGMGDGGGGGAKTLIWEATERTVLMTSAWQKRLRDTAETLQVLWYLEQLHLALMPDLYFKTKHRSVYISSYFFLSLNFSYSEITCCLDVHHSD